jgi:peptidyl-prolyl cis-trans isomerase A (cyclophilin A)
MLRQIWIAALVVACGKDKDKGKDNDSDDGPSCTVAVKRAAKRIKLGERKVDRMIDTCESEAWSYEMRRCIANADDDDEAEACGRKHARKRKSRDDDDDDDDARRKKKRRGGDDDLDDVELDMERIADDMCDCKSMACAKVVMDRAVKISEKNAGKDVSSRRAARYEREQKRIIKCMEEVAKRDVPAPAARPAVALDPLRAPTSADLPDYTRGIRGYGKLHATIDTSLGSFHCELYEDKAPMTVANFVGLATGKKQWLNPRTGTVESYRPFYDNLTFHRVIPGFMIQGGDPLGTGSGGPGYKFGDEVGKGLAMEPGMLAMANSGPATNGSQFFIMEARASWLDDKHTIFGRCDEIDLVKKITAVPRSATDKPNDDITIRRITFERR